MWQRADAKSASTGEQTGWLAIQSYFPDRKPDSVAGMALLTQCCCGCSLNTGTIIIGVFHLIMCFVQIMTSAYNLDNTQYQKDAVNREESVPETEIRLIIVLVSASVNFICNILLLFGAIQENAIMLIPWMVMNTLGLIILSVLGLIMLALIAASPLAVLGVVIVSIFVSFNGYLVYVVYSFYQTLRKNTKTHEDGECADTQVML